MPKILVSVLCSQSNPEYMQLESTIRETWGTQKHDNVDIIYYDSDENREQTFNVNTLVVKTVDMIVWH